jgi:ribonuclease HI
MSNLIIYTDGSCLNNPGPGGWAFTVFSVSNESLCEHFGHKTYATNNQMELQAVIEALGWILKNHGDKVSARVVTDSRYVQQGVTTWVQNWKRNNWRTAQGEPVKNQEYWCILDSLNARLDIDWQWVKAHHVDPRNLRVDHLARQGAETQRSSYV